MPPHNAVSPVPKPDSDLVKARTFRWKQMPGSGTCATIAELAGCEETKPLILARALRRMPSAPDIVEAVLDGTAARELTLAKVLEPFAEEWEVQHRTLCGPD